MRLDLVCRRYHGIGRDGTEQSIFLRLVRFRRRHDIAAGQWCESVSPGVEARAGQNEEAKCRQDPGGASWQSSGTAHDGAGADGCSADDERNDLGRVLVETAVHGRSDAELIDEEDRGWQS